MTEEQLAVFDLIRRGDLTAKDLKTVKQASKDLLDEILRLIKPLEHWTEKQLTQAEVKSFIVDHVYQNLPEPPYTIDDKEHLADEIF